MKSLRDPTEILGWCKTKERTVKFFLMTTNL